MLPALGGMLGRSILVWRLIFKKALVGMGIVFFVVAMGGGGVW